MNVAEKLRFLADRAEDEKEFYVGRLLHKYQNGKLILSWKWETEKDFEFIKSGMPLDSILLLDLKLKPQWEFTEDEKAILRNLLDDYRWIARDKLEGLYVYTSKPYKLTNYWDVEEGYIANIVVFTYLFQSIQWTDDEPCEFRKYL